MRLDNKVFLMLSIFLVACHQMGEHYCPLGDHEIQCNDGEIAIMKKGLFYPNYTVVGIPYSGVNYNYKIYIPKDKLEDYVYNHDEDEGKKIYNNYEKIIRMIKYYDEADKRKYREHKVKVYKGKGTCVKRDDLIYIDEVMDIRDVR